MNALERATAYLNRKPHTEKEVREYLLQKGYETDEIEAAIKELKQYSYIDDLSYARMFFEYGYEKGRGKDRIVRELRNKGLSRDLIEQAYEELDSRPDEYEMALQIAEMVLSESGCSVSELSYEEKQKLQARIVRRLASRGFSGSTCYSAAREMVK